MEFGGLLERAGQGSTPNNAFFYFKVLEKEKNEPVPFFYNTLRTLSTAQYSTVIMDPEMTMR
jgi:hypothetical protein